ncbi:MAG: tRNA isopentenyl-2-thiomethyl-A-37 hydroxylase MiaE [bacterium]
MAKDALTEIREFLPCETPHSWIECALENPDILLIDHANCEKKAASTALNLIYRYIDKFELLNKMSRLAREELRHFEQVIAIMETRNIPYRNITAARYAAGLRQPVRTYEPAKLVDTLIVGALIEARSCERFAALAPHLDDELRSFYLSLLKSEGRHYRDYLSLARQATAESPKVSAGFDARLELFRELEKDLILSPDREFRFHSGAPA